MTTLLRCDPPHVALCSAPRSYLDEWSCAAIVRHLMKGMHAESAAPSLILTSLSPRRATKALLPVASYSAAAGIQRFSDHLVYCLSFQVECVGIIQRRACLSGTTAKRHSQEFVWRLSAEFFFIESWSVMSENKKKLMLLSVIARLNKLRPYEVKSRGPWYKINLASRSIGMWHDATDSPSNTIWDDSLAAL